jgi:hypothetical protein
VLGDIQAGMTLIPFQGSPYITSRLLAGINEAHTLQEIKRAINKGREEMSVTSGQI